jgi:hypothetical protein
MPRVFRLVLSSLSAAAALLAAALWLRSHFVLDALSRSTSQGDTFFQSHRGRLHWRSNTWPQDPYVHVYVPEDRAGRWLHEHWPEPATPPDYPDPADTGVRHHWHVPGFAFVQSDGTSITPKVQSFSLSGSGRVTYPASRGVTIPHAALVVLFALPSTFHLIRARRRGKVRRRIAKGLCPSCGYDLRGTPQTQRCPECGVSNPSSDVDGQGP